jgi:hypothetical protein
VQGWRRQCHCSKRVCSSCATTRVCGNTYACCHPCTAPSDTWLGATTPPVARDQQAMRTGRQAPVHTPHRATRDEPHFITLHSPQEPTPQIKSTLHHITSHHITSHHITSHHITSDQIRSDQIRSDQIRSDQIRSDQIRSDQIRSHHITSHHTT